MNKSLRGIVGAAGVSLFWGAVWGAAGALLAMHMGANSWPWLGPPVGAFPGFIGGLLFSAMLAISSPGRRLDELSLLRVVAAGGIAGLVLGVLPLAINQPPDQFPLWQVVLVVVGSLTLLGVLTATVSLAVARWAKNSPALKRLNG